MIRSLERGGAEVALLTLIEGLLSRGHRVDLVLIEFQGVRLQQIPKAVNLFVLDPKYQKRFESVPCSLSADEIKWIKPPLGFRETAKALSSYLGLLSLDDSVRLAPRRRHIKPVLALRDYLTAEQPDLIYASLPRSCYISILARRLSLVRLPVIWSLHSDNIDKYSNRDRKYFEKLIGYADRIHTCSKGVAESVTKYTGSNKLPKSKCIRVTAIYNAFNAERILSLSTNPNSHRWSAACTNETKDDSSKLILSAGRLGSVKNFALLIRAFSLALKSIEAKLVILGEGTERENLENLARKLNVDHALSMPGHVDNPYSFMARADLFVLSSDYEGMPMVLGEALLCGCPIVSTDCPSGPSEFLVDGQWGRLVPVGDESAMADAIVASLMESPNRLEMKRRGMDFDVNHLIPLYETMFREVVDEYRGQV
ncbi:MAG: glycosyltransferase [Acidiferrobacterales bacterium]|nr:glycosyltransferase [Acidiferrobacterales bacterium]